MIPAFSFGRSAEGRGAAHLSREHMFGIFVNKMCPECDGSVSWNCQTIIEIVQLLENYLTLFCCYAILNTYKGGTKDDYKHLRNAELHRKST